MEPYSIGNISASISNSGNIKFNKKFVGKFTTRAAFLDPGGRIVWHVLPMAFIPWECGGGKALV